MIVFFNLALTNALFFLESHQQAVAFFVALAHSILCLIVFLGIFSFFSHEFLLFHLFFFDVFTLSLTVLFLLLLAFEYFGDRLEWKYNLLNLFPFLQILLLKQWQTLPEKVNDLFMPLELVAHLLHVVPALVDIPSLHVLAQNCIHLRLLPLLLCLEPIDVEEHEGCELIQLRICPIAVS